MYNIKTKTWIAPPPSYGCILKDNNFMNSDKDENSNTGNTLKYYMIITNQNVVDSQQQENDDSRFGRIYSISQLLERFGHQI
mmetsp:Transcript_3494/g.9253  ORF Transcript_3494/g.9253 Transcript_3494/m.9253 type:complete len:82 (-) Transcript_3494:301-546(-)